MASFAMAFDFPISQLLHGAQLLLLSRLSSSVVGCRHPSSSVVCRFFFVYTSASGVAEELEDSTEK